MQRMLDPWIIEEIRRREERDQREEQPVLEIPMDEPDDGDQQVREDEDKVERGVVIVDFRV